MSEQPQNKAKAFVGVDEEAIKKIMDLGVPAEMIEPLREEFGKLATDNVTGFHEGRSGSARFSTLLSLLQYVKETGEQAFYVDMDLQNLSGLNAKVGCTAANKIFAKIAAIIRHELTQTASKAVFFRHGGDEMSAFLIGTNSEVIQAALKTVQSNVRILARDCDLDSIPHSKHPDDLRWRGIGVYFGICKLTIDHEQDPTLVFRVADTELEEMKNKLGEGNSQA